MERSRLTKTLDDSGSGYVWIKNHKLDTCYGICLKENRTCTQCPIYKCLEKLSKYEDAEEQGRLIELPVARGSTVYYVPDYLYGQDSRIEELYVMGYRIFEDGATYLRVKQTRFSGTLVNIKRIGEDVFLTREEAEAKRKERAGDMG